MPDEVFRSKGNYSRLHRDSMPELLWDLGAEDSAAAYLPAGILRCERINLSWFGVQHIFLPVSH